MRVTRHDARTAISDMMNELMLSSSLPGVGKPGDRDTSESGTGIEHSS